MNIEYFKKLKIAAMKERNKNAVLALESVISKLMLLTIEKRAQGQQVTEGETLSILQKVEKELLEEKESNVKAGRTDDVAKLDEQIKTIAKYLPKMMSESEIRDIILQLDERGIAAVMKHFKTNYQGKVDMRMVSEVLKTL